MQASKAAHSHGSYVLIDAYACTSGIRSWNATLKVLFSLCVLAVCLLADAPWVSVATAALCSTVTVGRGRLPLRSYAKLLAVPAAFILMGTVAIAINFSRVPAGDYSVNLHWFFIYFTRDGLTKAAFLILKVFGAVSALFLMTLSTPAHELLTVLRKARCPKLIVELMHMIYRFIFILLKVQSEMRTSAQARLGFCSFQTSCYSFGSIAGNLLFLSLRKANAYYDAMEARCYTGDLLFLEEERGVSAEQLLWFGAGLALLLLVWVLTA